MMGLHSAVTEGATPVEAADDEGAWSWLDGRDEFLFVADVAADRLLTDEDDDGGPISGGASALASAAHEHAPDVVGAAGDAAEVVLPAEAHAAKPILLVAADRGMAEPVDDDATLATYTSGQGEFGFSSDFNVTIDFVGEWTAELQQDFIVAAEYLSYLITGDVRDKGAVDDIAITGELAVIDGQGGVLGQAGPTAQRLVGSLPTMGVMEFDAADAENFDGQGLFDDIVLHEMTHCLGLGTIWRQLGLLDGSVAEGDIRFTGENAMAAYKKTLAPIYRADPNHDAGVPVETDGGPGTAGGHWDEETFANELMTGYIDDENYVSKMTVASLEDLGYETIFDIDRPRAPILQPDDLLAFA